MSTTTRARLQQEAELLTRFAETYRGKFAAMIDTINDQPGQPPDTQCLRLCIEAVNMMLTSQTQIAAALRDIAA